MNGKRVLIGPIDIPGDKSVDASNLVNPGIGGSEMHSIALANVLSSQFEVTLWVRTGPFPQGRFHSSRNPLAESGFDVQIAFTSHAQTNQIDSTPLIAISHHPFDGHIVSLPKRTAVIVNVGRFQLLSNAQQSKLCRITQIWLPVFLRTPKENPTPHGQNKQVIAGHISSLHPSKGFLDVLKGWTKFLSNAEPGSQLRVLGGISLYGAKETHPTLPTEISFGNKISRVMQGTADRSTVFLGRLPGDIEHEIDKWDLAILNPKGWGESESVSMKDCWRMGVPVIAGNRFGQRDYMGDFPELQASSPRQIANLLRRYQRDKTALSELAIRAKEKYASLEMRGHLSAKKWLDLVNQITNAAGGDFSNFGIPIGKVTIRQKFAVWVDYLRITLHLSLIRVANLIRTALQ